MLHSAEALLDDVPMPWLEDAVDGVINPEGLGKKFENKPAFRFPSIAPPTLQELDAMALTPRCLLPDMLFADVRCRIAAGGTGKTTIMLYEAAMLAIGRGVWGRAADQAINTMIVTREDDRQTLLARLREVMRAIGLNDDERAEVLSRVRVMDMSANPFRLSIVHGDVVIPNMPGIDGIIEAIEAELFRPDWVILDPAVSFGVGESRVNDAEQGLIEAARIIRNRLKCCVEYIHHTGKANAKEKALDQYAGRGGSAFADGARMVCVMQPLTPEEWQKETNTPLEDGWHGLVMALPKMSYTKPQSPIFIKRQGWHFEQCKVTSADCNGEREAIANQVWQFLRRESTEGRRYSTKDLTLARDDMSLSKHQIESAVSRLKVSGRVILIGKAGIKQTLEAIEIRRATSHEPSPAGFGEGYGFCPVSDDDD